MQKPDVSTAARIAAVAIEELIRNDSTETGVLIASDGSIFSKRPGRSDKVSFPHWELENASGMTFTHNHPNGYAHSLADVKLAVLYSMHEVRVVTSEFRHSVSMLKRSHLGQLDRTFSRVEIETIAAAHHDVRRSVLNPIDFGKEVRHRTWQRLSAELGFHYWRQAP